MEKIKVAVVGVGNIADVHILRGYQKLPDFELYALCDINEARLNAKADRYGVARRYTDIDVMLAEIADEIDAVDVCVWNCHHASCAIKALNAGLHVFCEKPMAYNTAEAVAMKEAAEKAGKVLMIGFVTRYSNQGLIAKDMIDKGYLGDIYYAKAQYIRRHGNPGGWFADKNRSGGGPVIDLGVHVIDFTRYMMGLPRPVSVYASVQDRLGSRPHLKNGAEWTPDDASSTDKVSVEDFGVALIRFDNGAVTLLETTYDLNGADVGSRQLFGTKAGLDLTDNKVKMFTECNDYLADVNIITDNCKNGTDDAFKAELKDFAACVRGEKVCTATADDGIAVMKILDAIYESGRTGHEVVID